MERIIRYGWTALLAAMLGDVMVSLVLPIFYKDYNCMKMSISALGNSKSPVRIPFNIWMLIEGLLFLIAIPAIHQLYHPVSSGLTYTVIAFTILFAVGACIFTCFFSVNENKEIVTVASQIHGIGSVIGFMLFLFVPLLLAILSFKAGERSFGIVCIISFIIAMVFFVLFVMSDKPEFAGTIIENEGLWQRLNLVFMYLPFVLVSIKQIHEK
ncbi:DUF998 domain-containing protein [Eubacterium sp.]|uniref:DUF998 domain-containing protein n=1 Tax=Eubacterium sp. TaxID=142586 RepID=UPI00258EED8F|nr:DUF998 domain-containing protein [Eubacterium sp.]MCR5367498.1 DUF998 domain-containing protein [Eubacterium sp.]